jgi:3-deoxy-D-manno-octulosonic-acid transferase
MIRLIYNLFWPIGLLFFLPRYLLKMFRRGHYREKFGQRLGWYDTELRKRLAQQRSIWFHAVSVGEVRIAFKLIEEIGKLEPERHFILTTTTTTGFFVAKSNDNPSVEVMYNPLDFWPIMHRAFSVIRPKMVILIEAEVWPNLVAEAHTRGIPVALANARLSPRSEKRFHSFRFLVRPTFRLLDLVCVPEAKDIDRWAALGVDRGRIQCTGSIKFDIANVAPDSSGPEEVLRQRKIDKRRPILLAGSTHPGEEEILARIFLGLREKFPNLFLIIAPRHVERAREVRGVLEQLGLHPTFRTEPTTNQMTDCLILDSTGELQDWYPVATVVFVGKSLCGRGGQNPVEAIVAGKPVLFGPRMENFAALAESLVAQHGAIQALDERALRKAVDRLLGDDSERAAMVTNAQKVLTSHRGATARAAALLSALPAI